MAPFSMIVFGVVVWTIAVSGAKQLRFRFENGFVWTGSKLDGALSRIVKLCFRRNVVTQFIVSCVSPTLVLYNGNLAIHLIASGY